MLIQMSLVAFMSAITKMAFFPSTENKGMSKGLRFLASVILIVGSAAILIPLFVNLGALGGETTCKTICEWRMDPSWYNLIERGYDGVLEDWLEALNCPSCDTLLMDMEDIEEGEVMYVTILSEDEEDPFGDDSELEGWWLDDAEEDVGGSSWPWGEDGEDEVACNIRADFRDSPGGDERIWLSALAGVLLIAGSAVLAVVSFGVATPLAAGGAAMGIAMVLNTTIIIYSAGEVSRYLGAETGTEIGEEIDNVDDMDKLVNMTVNSQIVSYEMWRWNEGDCEEIMNEEDCEEGTDTVEHCYWIEDEEENNDENGESGFCSNIPEDGYEFVDITHEDDDYQSCMESAAGEDYGNLQPDDFRGEDAENFMDAVYCLLDERKDFPEEEMDQFKDFLEEISMQQMVLEDLTLKAESGECLGSWVFQNKENPCSPEACPDDLKDEAPKVCEIYTTPFDFDLTHGDACDDDYCALALPTYSEAELEEMEGGELGEKLEREGVYYWMPRGDAFCIPEEGWRVCNVGPAREEDYTFELEDEEITLTCSDYEWQISIEFEEPEDDGENEEG